MKLISYSQIIGTLLSWLRKQHNIEQTSFANKMDLTQASWSRIENGKAVINAEQMIIAANFLGVDGTYILMMVNNIKGSLEKNGYTVIDSKHINKIKDGEIQSIDVVRSVLNTHILESLRKSDTLGQDFVS